MNSIKELFSDVLQIITEVELEEKPDYEKSKRMSEIDETLCRKIAEMAIQ